MSAKFITVTASIDEALYTRMKNHIADYNRKSEGVTNVSRFIACAISEKINKQKEESVHKTFSKTAIDKKQ